MKKNAIVVVSAAVVLMFGMGSASADAQDGGGSTPSQGQERSGPDMHTRSCEEVGSGISDCTFDWMCWEDEEKQMSICEKRTLHIPEARDP